MDASGCSFGTDEIIFMDSIKFLIKAGEFKKWSRPKEELALKQTQVLTVLAILAVIVVWFLQKTKMGKAMKPSQIMKICFALRH